MGDFSRTSGASAGIALGIVSVVTPELESDDHVVSKIEEAAKYVPLENLSLSNNCGFSGASAEAWMTEDDERRKLELIARVAQRVWGE